MLKKSFMSISAFLIAMFVFVSNSYVTAFADWVKEADGSRYYVDESGKNLTGFQEIEGKTYYFNKDGKMQTKKWITTSSGVKYYFKSDGTMATGKLKIGKKTYYFGKNGKMRTNKWVTTSSGVKYYFKSDGTMATGKLKINGISYEFASNGKLIVLDPYKPLKGLKWGMTQSEVIKALNLEKDDYLSIDDGIASILKDTDKDSMFLLNLYQFADEGLIATGSMGAYSDSTLQYIKDGFENQGFVFLGPQNSKNGHTELIYLSKDSIGVISYNDENVFYLIFSDDFTIDVLNNVMS